MTDAFDAGWLALREPADHAARTRAEGALLPPLLAVLASTDSPARPLVVLDLGCGTGSNARWLAPRLPGPQHWVLLDHDPALLGVAAGSLTGEAPGSPPAGVAAVRTRAGAVTDLAAADLADVDLVTGSALLDVLTAVEVDHLLLLCVAARVPLLLALTVTGDVALEPPLPVDGRLAAAFDAHQRRSGPDGVRRLGPDAAAAATARLPAQGWRLVVADTPWQLGPVHAALAEQWHHGWVTAAVEQEPGLAAEAARAHAVRQEQAATGGLEVRVGHVDLLLLPEAAP